MTKGYRVQTLTTYEVTADNRNTFKVTHDVSTDEVIISLVDENGISIVDAGFVADRRFLQAVSDMFNDMDNARISYEAQD
jgi:hypothetical protein